MTAAAKLLSPATKGASATLRDLSMLCRVRRLFGDYFEVKTEAGRAYRVEAVYFDGDFKARCNCPRRVFRKEECRHELAVIRFERARVNAAQFGDQR